MPQMIFRVLCRGCMFNTYVLMLYLLSSPLYLCGRSAELCGKIFLFSAEIFKHFVLKSGLFLSSSYLIFWYNNNLYAII